MPSFLVIFLSVREKKKKKIAEKTKKIRAKVKGNEGEILIGVIKATVPKTKLEGTITEPIKSPKTIQFSFLLAETKAK